MSNEYYWTNKTYRSDLAKFHTYEMTVKYEKEIDEAIKNTKIYNGLLEHINIDHNKEMNISLKNTDSVSAIFDFQEGKTAVLNFASFKNPGGMFMTGSRAQEECLCHESFLYNVLKEFPTFYNRNKHCLNYGLYQDRALYTPNVIFDREFAAVKADVITCASPNFTAFSRYQADIALNDTALERRIVFVLEMAADNKVDNLILGAYGCGVFGQNPYSVAEFFNKKLKIFDCFKNVVFAIPDAVNKDNYKAFDKILNG